jgi:cell division ATPase FtsA
VLNAIYQFNVRNMLTETFMPNTIKPNIQEVKIPLTPDTATADADFMAVLSTATGNFSLVLQVSPNDVIRSTGMVAIPSEIVTASDVGRVLEAAMSLLCKDDVVMQASPICSFVVDNNLHTELMPIGVPATRLDVTVALVRTPTGMLQRWCDWANALGRNVIGWRIEIVFTEL